MNPLVLDRFEVGAPDVQDKPPYRKRDEWDGDGTIILSKADIERRKRLDLYDEEEEG